MDVYFSSYPKNKKKKKGSNVLNSLQKVTNIFN